MDSHRRTRLLLAACLVTICGAVWLVSVAQRDAASQTRTQERAAATMLTAMLDQETGLRGYINTRDRSFLEPYLRGRSAFDDAMARALSSVDSDDRAAIDVVQRQLRLARAWQQRAEDRRFAIERRRSGGFSADDARKRRDIMNAFRAANRDHVAMLDERRSDELSQAARLSVGVVVVLGVLFAAFGYAVVERRARRERSSRDSEARYVESQAEFTKTLQAMRNEGEAHTLVRRHLERSVERSSALVLNRNNSDDRLEPKTEIEPGSALAETLIEAEPSACVAVRLAHAYERDGKSEPLLECSVCGKLPENSLCVPSVVGGEVIGAVLVRRDGPLDAGERRCVQDSIAQAAPTLANLRNLEIAELRAATDALTGLPNQRAVRETLRRMSAQAARTVTPLAVVMLDLDHFKQINDVHGHGHGDDVLAAVGTILAGATRDSDFAGRWGGEEFLVLLPDTGRDGARVLAEKLRELIARIEVPGITREVTASFGVAVMPDDAGEPDHLVRAADRALYAAKAAGRNRVEIFSASSSRAS